MVARSAAGCSAISRPICDMVCPSSVATVTAAPPYCYQAGPKTCRPPIQVALA